MIRNSAFVFVAACTLAGASTAAAQTPPRVTVSLSAGYQPTTTDFNDRFEFTLHQETGSTETTYPVKGAFVAGGGVGLRLWRSIGAGVSVSYLTKKGAGETTSSVPHPFFLNRHREVVGDAAGLKRDETAVHVHLQYQLQATRSLHATLSAGPTFFNVNQDVVTNVNFNDQYPYDEATFANADSRRVKASVVGFNVGADFRQMLTQKFGVGLLLRYARAEVDLDAAENRPLTVDVGGFQVGLGLRLLF